MRSLADRRHGIPLLPARTIQDFPKGIVIDGAGDRYRVLPLRVENDPALQATVERPFDVEADQLAPAERYRRLVDRHLDDLAAAGEIDILRHQKARFLRNRDDDGDARDLFRHDLSIAVSVISVDSIDVHPYMRMALTRGRTIAFFMGRLPYAAEQMINVAGRDGNSY